jgi:hypothetical protein
MKQVAKEPGMTKAILKRMKKTVTYARTKKIGHYWVPCNLVWVCVDIYKSQGGYGVIFQT